MHGSPLTPQEAVASVALQVRRLEAKGLDPGQAIALTADQTGIDPEKVRWCVDIASAQPALRPRWATQRRRLLAVAAAL
jgi:hypothetical protein